MPHVKEERLYMLYGYMHIYIQCSQLIAYQYIATNIVVLNSLTEVIYVMTLSWF